MEVFPAPGREQDQFGRVFAHGVSPAVAPAIFDADVLPDDPTRVLQTLRERSQEGLTFRVVRGEWREHADAPHSVRLLGARAASGYAAVPPRAVIIAASQGLRDAPLNHLPLRKGEVAKILFAITPTRGAMIA